LNEQFTQTASGRRLKLECFLNLSVGDKAPQHEDVTELAASRAGRDMRNGWRIGVGHQYGGH
jgi:hypothetical protein